MLKDCRDANTVGWRQENRQSRDDLKRKVSTENGSEERIARALLGMAFAQTTGARDKSAEMEMCLNVEKDCRRKKKLWSRSTTQVLEALSFGTQDVCLGLPRRERDGLDVGVTKVICGTVRPCAGAKRQKPAKPATRRGT